MRGYFIAFIVCWTVLLLPQAGKCGTGDQLLECHGVVDAAYGIPGELPAGGRLSNPSRIWATRLDRLLEVPLELVVQDGSDFDQPGEILRIIGCIQ